MSSSVPPSQYYVYVLARPDNRVFYVGKGKGSRLFDHEREAKRGCRCHKCSVIRKIWSGGGEVQRYTLLTTDNETAAFEYEIELIAQYGRANLTNHTDGGDGMRNPSQETRAAQRQVALRTIASPEAREAYRKQMESAEFRESLSARAKAVWLRPETRETQRRRLKESLASPDARAAMSARAKTQKETPEARASQSERSKELWSDPEMRERMVSARSARNDTPEARAAISKRMKVLRNTPEARANTSIQTKAYRATPEAQAAYSARLKDKWEDPEYRERTKKQVLDSWSDPVIRARRVEGMRARWAARRAAKALEGGV